MMKNNLINILFILTPSTAPKVVEERPKRVVLIKMCAIKSVTALNGIERRPIPQFLQTAVHFFTLQDLIVLQGETIPAILDEIGTEASSHDHPTREEEQRCAICSCRNHSYLDHAFGRPNMFEPYTVNIESKKRRLGDNAAAGSSTALDLRNRPPLAELPKDNWLHFSQVSNGGGYSHTTAPQKDVTRAPFRSFPLDIRSNYPHCLLKKRLADTFDKCVEEESGEKRSCSTSGVARTHADSASGLFSPTPAFPKRTATKTATTESSLVTSSSSNNGRPNNLNLASTSAPSSSSILADSQVGSRSSSSAPPRSCGNSSAPLINLTGNPNEEGDEGLFSADDKGSPTRGHIAGGRLYIKQEPMDDDDANSPLAVPLPEHEDDYQQIKAAVSRSDAQGRGSNTRGAFHSIPTTIQQNRSLLNQKRAARVAPLNTSTQLLSESAKAATGFPGPFNEATCSFLNESPFVLQQDEIQRQHRRQQEMSASPRLRVVAPDIDDDPENARAVPSPLYDSAGAPKCYTQLQ